MHLICVVFKRAQDETGPFNISMSSDSSSAIHLGGEFVIGWKRTRQKEKITLHLITPAGV